MEIRMEFDGLATLQRRFAKAPEIVGQELRRGMDEAVFLTEAEVVQRTPVDTGRGVGSIQTRVEVHGASITGYVESANVAYMIYQEWGTGVHSEYPGAKKAAYEIRPRTARMLRFVGRSGVVFRRRVMHPGVRPRRMFRDGGEAARPAVERAFGRANRRALKRIATGA